MAKINVNVTDHTPISARDPLPPGDYAVMIVASDVKETKSGSGQYLELEMDVVEGEFQGRKLWDRLNLWNANEKAVDIANRTLRAITDAVGHPPVVEDSESLHGKALLARVVLKQETGYEPKNEVKGYSAYASQAPAAALGARAPAAGPTAPARAPARAPAQAAPAARAGSNGSRPAWVK